MPPKMSNDDLLALAAYKRTAEDQPFCEMLRNFYRRCRENAKQSFEKTDSAAAYWSGRADSLEILLGNIEDSKKVKIKEKSAQPSA